ncbi:MAG TPA: hypothetical protein ENK43_14310 [Planctomycetes bacterium]|nr:hypothetical protein [Planctomycetota bacterium]
METRFECIFEGKKLFRVVNNSATLFTGTWSQCERFKDVYKEKVRKSRLRHSRAGDRPLRPGRF